MTDTATEHGGGVPPSWPPSDYADAATGVVLREFHMLARLHRQSMHRSFAKQCLHPAQMLCIAVLARQGELAQSELAEALILTRPSVTRLVQRMERAGLVIRRTDDADQRQTLVSLTPAGRELQGRMHEAMIEYSARTLALLPPEDRADLARILPTWRKLAEEGPP
jgi:DNA-binding MarR family transcriptional regulator